MAASSRPWWRRKRFGVLSILSLLFLWYPASRGVAYYCVGRGWVSDSIVAPLYKPVIGVQRAIGSIGQRVVKTTLMTKSGPVQTVEVRRTAQYDRIRTFHEGSIRYEKFVSWCRDAGEKHAR